MGAISRVLALDTAMNGCVAAVYNTETDQAFSAAKVMARGQAEVLVPMIQDVLALAGCGFDAIDLIVTTKGPGAFTGLRIGLSTAKSLALALDIPVIGLDTLAVLARQYLASHASKAGEKCAVLIETKREDFYVRVFDHEGVALCAPQAVPLAGAVDMIGSGKVVVVGDAVKRFSALHTQADMTFHEIILPDPESMARQGLAQYLKDEENIGQTLQPLYLRAPDVSQPKKQQRFLAQKNS